MLASFRNVKSKYKMVVLDVNGILTENNRKIIEYYGAEVRVVDGIYPASTAHIYSGLERPEEQSCHICMSKLNVFNLTEFDKIVYVDSDMVFFKNCDELFTCKHMSAVKDVSWEQFNAGLMVIEPNETDFTNLISILASYNNKDFVALDDQKILYQYFNEWPKCEELHLPNIYNFWAIAFNPYSQDFMLNMNNIAIFHMSGTEKPWVNSNPSYYKSAFGEFYYAIMLYYTYLMNTCVDELVEHGFEISKLHMNEKVSAYDEFYKGV